MSKLQLTDVEKEIGQPEQTEQDLQIIPKNKIIKAKKKKKKRQNLNKAEPDNQAVPIAL